MTMNQPVPDELISAYFDGEVTPDERRQVERLLESSAERRQSLDDTSKLSALLHSFPREAAPADLATNVQTQIQKIQQTVAASATAKPRNLRREWTAFATGIFATLASLVLYVAGSPSPYNTTKNDAVRLQVATRDDSNHNRPTEDRIVAQDHVDLMELPADLPVPSAPGFSVVNNNSQLAREVNPPIATGTLNESLSTTSPLSLALKKSTVATEPEKAAAPNLLVAQPQNVQVGEMTGEMQLVPQPKEEFLQSLKRGDVIVQHVADPDNTVMIVELVVVDIDKGIEEMRLLLQKRDLRPAENDLPSGISTATKGTGLAGKPASQKIASPDELIVLYVRASGTQLADALAESVQLHPEIYRELAPQLPIELRLNQNSASASAATADVKADGKTPAQAFEVHDTAPDQPSVAAEADFVIHSFASLNGMTVNDDRNRDIEWKETQRRKARILAGTIAGKGVADSAAAPVANGDDSDSPLSKTPLDKKDVKSDKASQDIGNSSQGYATFRVAVDNQRHPTQQQGPTRQNRGGAPVNLFAGNSLSFGVVDNFQQKPARSNFGQRDPRLMRMLIVLKTEQIAAHP